VLRAHGSDDSSVITHLSDSCEHCACSDWQFSRSVLYGSSVLNIIVAGTHKSRGVSAALGVVLRTPLVDRTLLDVLVQLHLSIRADVVFHGCFGVVFISLIGDRTKNVRCKIGCVNLAVGVRVVVPVVVKSI
jgi:hypothetical protein